MTTCQSQQLTANTFPADLKEQPGGPLEFLVITHNGVPMTNRLRERFRGRRARFLDLHQAQWKNSLLSLVRWAIRNDVANIVLAGHSSVADHKPADPNKGSIGESRDSEISDAFTRLLMNSRQTEVRTQNSKNQFKRHVDDVLDVLRDCGKEHSKDPVLHPVFYIENGDLFLEYSIADRRFRPATDQDLCGV